MIINVGLRYDYFDPNSWVPMNPHDPYIQNPRDPHLDAFSLEKLLNINWADTSHYVIDFETKDTLWYIFADYGSFSDMGNGKWDADEEYEDENNNGQWDTNEPFTDLSDLRYEQGWYRKTRRKSQWSPRFGIAYPISDKGVIHFSYGYFFQIPQFENLYRDPGYKISEGSGTFGVFGNPDLEPQKTISYELGLQHKLENNYKMELTGYFRDVRDWVSTGIPIDLGGGAVYYTFVNKDYSSVRGILLALDRKYMNSFSWHLDYTFQIVEGSHSDPEEEYGAQLDNSEPTRSIVPLNWDQRHNFNASVFVGNSKWGTDVIMQFGSGYPYTPDFLNSSQNISMFSSNNSMRKNYTINFDLKAFRNFSIAKYKCRLFLNIYNVFDRRNENIVWGNTGRSDQSAEIMNKALLVESLYPEILRPNTIQDFLNHPEWYYEPRQIQIGLKIKW
jgi:outer membrane receptor protein involved in Fe transport